MRPEVVPPPSRAASILLGLAAFAGGVAAMVVVPLLLAEPVALPSCPAHRHHAVVPLPPPGPIVPMPPLPPMFDGAGAQPTIALEAGESVTIHAAVPRLRVEVALPCDGADVRVMADGSAGVTRLHPRRSFELRAARGRASYTASCPGGATLAATIDLAADDGHGVPHAAPADALTAPMPNLAGARAVVSVAQIQDLPAEAWVLDPLVTVRASVLPGTTLVAGGSATTQHGAELSTVVIGHRPWFELRFAHPTYGTHIYVVTPGLPQFGASTTMRNHTARPTPHR